MQQGENSYGIHGHKFLPQALESSSDTDRLFNREGGQTLTLTAAAGVSWFVSELVTACDCGWSRTAVGGRPTLGSRTFVIDYSEPRKVMS